MDPRRWPEIRARFDELVDLDPDELTIRLAAIAATDPELHRAVASLVAADAGAGERLRHVESALLPPSSPATNTFGTLPDPLGLTGHTISHYRVLEPLGVGGMGVVYRAEDTRLDRKVALKFLLPQYSLHTQAKDRFLHEARSAGALDHPNICTIYDVGESEDGRLFLAMPLYAGELLEARLAREGPLPIGDAIEIARQIASGLTCAHAAGIVHRDLKPGNLMLLPEGMLKILDFGLAKARDLTLTDPGHRPGTVAYMAPEQIRGEAVDPRTDLWALGAILYEMVTGKRPFGADHAFSMAYAIAHEEPIAPASLRDDVSSALDQVVLRLLRKQPGKRCQSASDFLETLARINTGAPPPRPERRAAVGGAWSRARLGAASLGVVAVGAVVIMAVAASLGEELPDVSALRSDIAQEIAEVLQLELTPAARDHLDTPPRPNAQAYDVYLRAREYQLRGDHLESQRVAEELYSRAVKLDPDFALAHARLAYTHGWFFYFGHDTSQGRLEQMRLEAETALRLEPDLPEAHLAMGYYWYTGPRDFRKALEEFEAARRASPGDAEMHAAVAYVDRRQGRWEKAVEGLEHAVELDPRYPKIMKDLAVAYMQLRRYPEAVRTWDRVLGLEPDNYTALLLRAGTFLAWQGTTDSLAAALPRIPAGWDPRGDRTIAAATLAQLRHRPLDVLAALGAMRPEVVDDRDYLQSANLIMLGAQAHLALGDTARARAYYSEARATLEQGAIYHADARSLRATLAVVLARLGHKEEAIREAKRARDEAHLEAAEGHRYLVSAAESYAWAGESDAALEVLAQVIGSPGQLSVHHLRLEPRWDPMRSHPRFQRLIAAGMGGVAEPSVDGPGAAGSYTRLR